MDSTVRPSSRARCWRLGLVWTRLSSRFSSARVQMRWLSLPFVPQPRLGPASRFSALARRWMLADVRFGSSSVSWTLVIVFQLSRMMASSSGVYLLLTCLALSGCLV